MLKKANARKEIFRTNNRFDAFKAAGIKNTGLMPAMTIPVMNVIPEMMMRTKPVAKVAA